MRRCVRYTQVVTQCSVGHDAVALGRRCGSTAVRRQKKRRNLERTRRLINPAMVACIFTADMVVTPIEFDGMDGLALVIADPVIAAPDLQPEEGFYLHINIQAYPPRDVTGRTVTVILI